MTGNIININPDLYFDRINYRGKTDVSEETLMELHTAHTLNVPFENLDVFYGVPVLLDEKSLFDKIVTNSRGGYCFEMNGLFSLVLKKLGYRVKDLLARVTIDGIEYTAKTHQVLLIELNDRLWLADVGFGNNGLMAPVILEEERDQKQFAHTYRLIADDNFGYVLQKKEITDYESLYAFTLDECFPMDFLMSNHFTSTFPESFFRQMRMCTMPTREGRITLTDNCFKISSNGDSSEKAVENDDEFSAVLKKYFDLDLDRIIP